MNKIKQSLDDFSSVFNDNLENAQPTSKHVEIELRKMWSTLSQSEEVRFEWKQFIRHDSFKIVCSLLQDLSEIILNSESFELVAETVYDSIKILLEIVFYLAKISNEFVELFKEQNMFNVILSIFESLSLIEFLFFGYMILLTKINAVLFSFCKNIFHSNDNAKINVKRVSKFFRKRVFLLKNYAKKRIDTV